MKAPSLKAILEALPADVGIRLKELREVGRGPFGNMTTQQVVDRNLDLIRRLRALGATHADSADVLMAYGITTDHGKPLAPATLSSAISRAEAKAPDRQVPGRRPGRSTSPSRPSPRAFRADDSARTSVGNGVAVLATAPAKMATTGVGAFADGATAGTEAISVSRRAPEIARDVHRAAILALLHRSMED
jgi:hypothetical protein